MAGQFSGFIASAGVAVTGVSTTEVSLFWAQPENKIDKTHNRETGEIKDLIVRMLKFILVVILF